MASAPNPVEAARLFQALSDPTRLDILVRLRGGERCVCELQGDLDAAQSRLSFHLRVLRDAGLVTDRKEGRWVYYTAVPGQIEAMERALAKLKPRVRQLPVMSGC